MNKYKELVKNIIVFAVGGLGTKVILFLLVPIYTNYLTTDEYGIAELVFTISQFLIPIITLNIYDALIRFGLSIQENRNNVIFISILVWGIGSGLLYIIAPTFSLFYSIAEWKWYLIAFVVFSGLSQIELNYLKVIEKNYLYSVAAISQTLILAISNILFIVVIKGGIRGYLFSNVISLVFSSILCFLFGKLWTVFRTASFDRVLFLKMIRYSIPLIFNNISWWVIHSTDKLMIHWMIGASVLGIYTVSAKIPSMLNVVSGFFVQAWGLSSIKEIETSNDLGFYSKVFEWFTGSILLLCVVVNSFIRPFMYFYTGTDFNSAWQYVPALLIAAVFNAISLYFAAFYAALKKTINNMITTIISALINIIVNYILIMRIGAWGAVIGTVSSYCVVAYLRLFDIRRYIKMRIDWGVHLFSVAIAIIHMFCVTKEFHPIIVSVLSLLILLYMNRKGFNRAITILKTRMGV